MITLDDEVVKAALISRLKAFAGRMTERLKKFIIKQLQKIIAKLEGKQ